MKKWILLNKSIGKTPLQAIQKFVEINPEYRNVKLAYAGRLDPMAEGLLLVLVGDECKNRKFYEQLPKTYEFEVLFGISTDTYDVLGMLDRGQTLRYEEIFEAKRGLTSHELGKACLSFVGKQNQPYPPYSSTRVNGKPLFYWARERKLDQVKIPTKLIEVYSLEYISNRLTSATELYQTITQRIQRVSGEFRQKEILKSWNHFFKDHPYRRSIKDDPYLIAKLKTTCSSGTYVRSIAHEMGKKLKTGAIAFSIKRTQIGDYSLPSHSA